MNRKIVRAVALGGAGLVVALLLTVGAFAIAGREISQPAGVPVFTMTPSPGSSVSGDRSPETDRTQSRSPAGDHAGSDDNGGGSGSDRLGEGGSSGSGSDDSGSGSNDSGSDDSSGSGSGKDEHEDD